VAVVVFGGEGSFLRPPQDVAHAERQVIAQQGCAVLSPVELLDLLLPLVVGHRLVGMAVDDHLPGISGNPQADVGRSQHHSVLVTVVAQPLEDMPVIRLDQQPLLQAAIRLEDSAVQRNGQQQEVARHQENNQGDEGGRAPAIGHPVKPGVFQGAHGKVDQGDDQAHCQAALQIERRVQPDDIDDQPQQHELIAIALEAAHGAYQTGDGHDQQQAIAEQHQPGRGRRRLVLRVESAHDVIEVEYGEVVHGEGDHRQPQHRRPV